MSTSIQHAFSPSACRELVRAWHFELSRVSVPRTWRIRLPAIAAVLRTEGDAFRSAEDFATWASAALGKTPTQIEAWLSTRRGSL